MSVNYKETFESFGLNLTEANETQWKCMCPFSGKKDKLYINKLNGLWDSKVVGVNGNVNQFMNHFFDWCLQNTKPDQLVPLTDKKGIPIDAFIGQVAWNPLNDEFLIPTRNHDGDMVDLGRWRPSSKFVARTKHMKTGLSGSELIPENDLPIYICEGEWDMFALRWVHKTLDYKSIVLCVPGASVFKEGWGVLFEKREVYLCYDNDIAGRRGEDRTSDALKVRTDKIKYLQWHELHRDKYDVRDLVLEHAKPLYSKNAVKRMWALMQSMFSDYSRKERENPSKEIPSRASDSSSPSGSSDSVPENGTGDSKKPGKKKAVIIPTIPEIEEAYGKWLRMANFDILAYMFGVCFANKIQGDPVWGMIVAPPGGSKTELLMTLSGHDYIETVTTITPAALVSGMKTNPDPSMIPRLNGRLLVIKDFTAILSMAPLSRDEVFGIFRDVYDGYIEKNFGNGIRRAYRSSFGILAGVTPAIDSYSSVHASLGERFIKRRLDRSIMPETEEERLMRVLSNVNQESKMREELRGIANRMLSKPMPTILPNLQDKYISNVIMKCARFTAKMRSSITKDKYTKEMSTSPVTEIATRLTKQYCKLAIGVAIYYGHDEIGEKELDVVRAVAYDTSPEIITEMIRIIYQETYGSPEAKVDRATIEKNLNINMTTIHIILENLEMLGIVKKLFGSDRLKTFYRCSDDMIDIIKESGVCDFR